MSVFLFNIVLYIFWSIFWFVFLFVNLNIEVVIYLGESLNESYLCFNCLVVFFVVFEFLKILIIRLFGLVNILMKNFGNLDGNCVG